MAREGMATLIRRLRAMTGAGDADHTIGQVTYWSDDQLQEALDATQHTLLGERLAPLHIVEGGAVRTYAYGFPFGRHFEEDAPDSGWAVKDSRGQTVTGYSVDYAARRITFPADQRGAAYFLDARTYNLAAAAAAVWEQKAAFAAGRLDWWADDRYVRGGQEYQHCMAMAAHCRRLAGPKVTRLARVDSR